MPRTVKFSTLYPGQEFWDKCNFEWTKVRPVPTRRDNICRLCEEPAVGNARGGIGAPVHFCQDDEVTTINPEGVC